ncbi:PfkB family carbohydrate kinase [Oceanotoga sp. DSM 15011]|jgi:adenosine kinase|uniref:Adenosine kinase n=1 Tax=Oceanotoga teriensis TaxID=515440 RepID=A0AA45C6W6_9BACT|nr:MULTISPECIES: PfkB family carbohydrate kinase [Oceanotoga]PWJ93249.1 adenosine kinase [Oceanotoga teriensis]UYP01246.1 PfkB family carbohydrate kinase [Oceanotoga sp. DSM 15011]
MTNNIDILACGYPSLDRIIYINDSPQFHKTTIIKNGDYSRVYMGGCNVNIATILSVLGKTALPLMRVGDDFETSGFKNFLEERNVNLDGIERIKNVNTSGSLLIEDPQGNHITLFYKGAMDSDYKVKIDEMLIKKASYLVITVGEFNYNKRAAELAIKNNIPIIFGMKCDFDAFDHDLLKKIIHNSSIIFMNGSEKIEIEKICELSKIENLFKDSKKLKCAVITHGNKPAEIIYLENDEIKKSSVDIIKTNNVLDTTGAGDAYMAGFIFGFLNGEKYEKCAQIGSTISSFIIEKKGCLENIPDKKRLEKRLTEYYGG